MTSLQQEIAKHIKILRCELKPDKDLLEILKRRLTKKEFKCLQSLSQGEDNQTIMSKLNLNKERFDSLSQTLTKKLNQEKLKHELSLFSS
ncbi:MAG TPA: hypothetical protein ENN12_01285 [Epsilonproteobacteria bacterium]|nr:hypothetical protein [Campylobacterota bacterium]